MFKVQVKLGSWNNKPCSPRIETHRECLHSEVRFLFSDYTAPKATVIEERNESITEHGLLTQSYTAPKAMVIEERSESITDHGLYILPNCIIKVSIASFLDR